MFGFGCMLTHCSNFHQESLSTPLPSGLSGTERSVSMETEEGGRDSDAEEVVVSPTGGLGDSAGVVQQSDFTELEVEEALTATYEEAVRRTSLARLDEFIESQRQSVVNVKGHKKRHGVYDKHGSPSKKRATTLAPKTSSPVVSKRSELSVNRPPVSRASTASFTAESVRDTFGHAFELSSAWLQSDHLVCFCSV